MNADTHLVGIWRTDFGGKHLRVWIKDWTSHHIYITLKAFCLHIFSAVLMSYSILPSLYVAVCFPNCMSWGERQTHKWRKMKNHTSLSDARIWTWDLSCTQSISKQKHNQVGNMCFHVPRACLPNIENAPGDTCASTFINRNAGSGKKNNPIIEEFMWSR